MKNPLRFFLLLPIAFFMYCSKDTHTVVEQVKMEKVNLSLLKDYMNTTKAEL
jgi:hypothetical protein